MEEKKMLVLKEREVCPFRDNCPFIMEGLNLTCQGTLSNRIGDFICAYVNPDGTFLEGHMRNELDKTGKMELLQG